MPTIITYRELTQIIKESSTITESHVIKRKYLKWLIKNVQYPLIKVIQGIRRSGKSLVLKQFYTYLLNHGIPKRNILFLNFENPLLSFCNNDLDLRRIYELFLAHASPTKPIYVFLDEIQEVPRWERFVRWLYDTQKEKVQIYITGSNSKLLSSEFTTLLAGRHISTTIFPFSLKEIRTYYKPRLKQANFDSHLTNIVLNGLNQAYFNWGGMPEIVPYLYIINDNSQVNNKYILSDSTQPIIIKNYINTLVQRIITNDIINRYQIRDGVMLKKLTIFLLSNIGKTISLRKIQNILKSEGYHTSVDTLSQYIQYLQNSFLIFKIPRFDFKTKQIFRNIYKYYTIDNGLITTMSTKSYLTENNLLENLVFLHFFKKKYDIFYTQNNYEVDFVIKTPKNRYVKVQVTYKLTAKDFDREVGNLIKASQNLKGKNYLITFEPIDYYLRKQIAEVTKSTKTKIHFITAEELIEKD